MTIRVDHAGLQQAADDLVASARAIENRLDLMEQNLKKYVNEWSGDARDTYFRSKATWDECLRDMKKMLENTSAAVVRANDDYRNQDRKSASTFEIKA